MSERYAVPSVKSLPPGRGSSGLPGTLLASHSAWPPPSSKALLLHFSVAHRHSSSLLIKSSSLCVCMEGWGRRESCMCWVKACGRVYLYALNQILIFSGTVVTETLVASTMALKSVFTTKTAMCSEVPSGFWAWMALTSCSPSRSRRSWGSTVVVWRRGNVSLLVCVHTHTHTHTR